MNPLVDGGNTPILCHKNLKNLEISVKPLSDDAMIEVTWDGEIVWELISSDHFGEMEFSEEAKNIMRRNPNMRHAGDKLFHPDNII
jgi:hypothetical protein